MLDVTESGDDDEVDLLHCFDLCASYCGKRSWDTPGKIVVHVLIYQGKDALLSLGQDEFVLYQPTYTYIKGIGACIKKSLLLG